MQKAADVKQPAFPIKQGFQAKERLPQARTEWGKVTYVKPVEAQAKSLHEPVRKFEGGSTATKLDHSLPQVQGKVFVALLATSEQLIAESPEERLAVCS